jgi:periplasmic divalent cation tolerance protein
MKIIEVWITCPDQDVAESIGFELVSRRLAACANTHAPVRSAYHWKGSIESEDEVPLVVKTRDDLFDSLVTAVETLHPYETPGIVGVAVEYLNQSYADWVVAETRQA